MAIAHRRAVTFYGLTLLWTWSAWGLAIALGRPWSEPSTVVLWAVGALGPVIAASTLAWRGSHRRPLRAFWTSVVSPRVSMPLVAASVVLAAGPYLIAALLVEGRLTLAGEPQLAFLAAGLVAGLAEEPGWRGYAQDELQRTWRPAIAMLAVGVGWAAWHLPLFAMAGTYQHGIGFATTEFWLFLVTLVPHAVLYGWIYLVSGASIFAVVVFHALQNAAAELLSVPGAEVAELAVTSAIAIVIVMLAPRTRRRLGEAPA